MAPSATPQESEPEEPPPVRMDLLADVDRLTPGASFHLAARIRLPAHWHVYWENPGDSGMPTEVEFSAPPGFEIGAPVFPGPARLELAGGLVSYGYEGELVVFVPVKAPDPMVEPAHLSFGVEARWLICKEACFLGGEKAELDLPVGPGSPRPANEELLAPHRERLPRPWKELEENSRDCSQAWSRLPDGSRLPALSIAVPGADGLDWFPGTDSPLELVRVEAGASADSILLIFYEPGSEEPHVRARGLLRVLHGETVRFYGLDCVIPTDHRR